MDFKDKLSRKHSQNIACLVQRWISKTITIVLRVQWGTFNNEKIVFPAFVGSTTDDIKAPSAELQENGVKIITVAVEADRIQANTISSIVMFEGLVEFLYDSDEKLNRIVKMINEGWLHVCGVIFYFSPT